MNLDVDEVCRWMITGVGATRHARRKSEHGRWCVKGRAPTLCRRHAEGGYGVYGGVEEVGKMTGRRRPVDTMDAVTGAATVTRRHRPVER